MLSGSTRVTHGVFRLVISFLQVLMETCHLAAISQQCLYARIHTETRPLTKGWRFFYSHRTIT